MKNRSFASCCGSALARCSPPVTIVALSLALSFGLALMQLSWHSQHALRPADTAAPTAVHSATLPTSPGGADVGRPPSATAGEQSMKPFPFLLPPPGANVTFIVKAFERRLCLARLLDSTAAVYPNVPVIVLDDSSAPLLNTSELSAATQRLPYLRYILSPFDVGLAAGRNALVDEVTTPFVLLLDDDFILEAGSGIERLQDVLERGVFDLAGGCIDSAHGYSLLRSNAQLEVRADIACVGQADRPPVWQTPDLSCWQVDMINNFFLARTDFLRQVRWDPRLKLGEHEDFYLRVQAAGGRVGLCRGASAVNDNSCDTSSYYKGKRSRVFEFWTIVFQKHGFREMRTPAGKYTLLCDSDGAPPTEAAPAQPPSAGSSPQNASHEETAGSARPSSAAPSTEMAQEPPVILPPHCHIDVQQDNIWFQT